MASSITDEIVIFLYSCLSGILIMFFYDVLSVAKRKKSAGVFIVNICDGIFIVVSSAIMMFIIFSTSRGIVRGFEFLGAASGAVLYKFTISRFILLALTHFVRIISSFFNFFLKILLTPIKFMYKMINKCIVVLFYPVMRLLKKIKMHFSFKIRSFFKTAHKTIRKT